MENIEKLLHQILENQVKAQSGITELKTKLEIVIDQVAGLTEFRDATIEKLDQIGMDVRFMKQKALQNEEEIFHLKEAFKYSK